MAPGAVDSSCVTGLRVGAQLWLPHRTQRTQRNSSCVCHARFAISEARVATHPRGAVLPARANNSARARLAVAHVLCSTTLFLCILRRGVRRGAVALPGLCARPRLRLERHNMASEHPYNVLFVRALSSIRACSRCVRLLSAHGVHSDAGNTDADEPIWRPCACFKFIGLVCVMRAQDHSPSTRTAPHRGRACRSRSACWRTGGR